MSPVRDTIRWVAEDMEEEGISFFAIEDGFFYSTRRAPQVTYPMRDDDNRIPSCGDTLLRVYCDKGTVSLYWPYARFDDERNEIPVVSGPHIEVFKDGYPHANGGSMPRFTKSDPTATVWATYEIYGPKHHETVRTYAESSDRDKGLKMRYGEEAWQIVGRLDPGHSVNTIQRIKQHSRGA